VNLNMFYSMLIGYFLGCIQSAYLLGRLIEGIDIREHGSGNAGASNITSTLGIKWGVIVGGLDILKGALAVLFVKWLFPGQIELAFLAGLMAVVGHIFPFYLNFRGGKGVAALVGVMFGIQWYLGLIFVLLVAIPAFLTDYIVSGSFTTFLALPIFSWYSDYSAGILGLTLILAVLCFYLHRGNIRRILAGEEVKISSVLFKSEPSGDNPDQ